MNSIHQQPLYV